MSYSIDIRVYYEDTDSTGVVYHAGYLRYFERARTEWLRALGFSHQSLMRTMGVAFTVSRLRIDYLHPARLDDALNVEVAVTQCGRASLEFTQSLRREEGAVELARARVRVACVDAASFRPCGLPQALRERIVLEPEITERIRA